VGPGCRVVRRVEADAGEPAVVLEAGGNGVAESWQRVMPLLAPHVRVVAYDRAGLGGSAPAPGLATIDRMIDDLASGWPQDHACWQATAWAASWSSCWPSAGRTWLRAWSWWIRGTRRWRACCPCPSGGGGGSCATSAPMSCTMIPP
jgi:pimeloyl-ACP methyl ester carboxylesterase